VLRLIGLIVDKSGAYSLGQEIMGHKKRHMAHIVAEALGEVAAIKDTKDHVSGVE
jgi:hypothetical protein